MPGSVVVGGVALAATAVVCIAVIVGIRPARSSVPRGRWRSGVVSTVDFSIGSLGRFATAAVVLLAGYATVLLTCWVLGKVAHALESPVDWPVFTWFEARQGPGEWHRLWGKLTLMGNRRQTQGLAVLAALVLSGLWALSRRPRWWIPLCVLPMAYLFEKSGQMIIKAVVHRGHPPTTNGTWPSGGCARLIFVLGMVIFLVLWWRRTTGRRTWAIGWSVLAIATMAEAYSRTYLLKHWVTDVVGGVIYGVLGLVVMMAVVAVLDRDVDGPAEAGRHRHMPGDFATQSNRTVM